MAKTNAEYWAERNRIMQNALQNKSLAYSRNLEKQFKGAIKDIDKQMRAWYQRFANNNQISYAAAQKLLTTGELKEFKWTVQEYIAKAKENSLNGAWVRELENASARVHISRLEALKIQLQQQAEALTGARITTTTDAAAEIYKNSYYHTAFEVQRGLGVGWSMQALNDREIQKVLSRPWTVDNRTFTARCWTDKKKLVQTVNQELTRMIATGASPDRAIDVITQQFGVSARNAARVVMTESAYFATAAQRDCFNDLDVEEYQVVGTFDKKTCEICGEMNGKVFPMAQFQAGATAPPFHPWCRCCTAPYFADMADVGKRWSRNPDTGRGELLPANTTYDEWREKYINHGAPPAPVNPPLQIPADGSIIKDTAPPEPPQNEPAAPQERIKLEAGDFPPAFNKGAEKKQTQALVDAINGCENADQRVIGIYKNMAKYEDLAADGIELKIEHTGDSAVTTYYRRTANGGKSIAKIKVDTPRLLGDEYDIGRLNTALHEDMHFIDCLNRTDKTGTGGWFSSEFKPLRDAFPAGAGKRDIGEEMKKLLDEYNAACEKARAALSTEWHDKISTLNEAMLKRTYQGTYSDYKKEYNRINKEYAALIDAEERRLMGGGVNNLQDIYDALSGGWAQDHGVVKFGHGSKYYADFESRMHETAANYAALSVTRPDLVEMLRADKPDLVKALDDMIDELAKKGGAK